MGTTLPLPRWKSTLTVTGLLIAGMWLAMSAACAPSGPQANAPPSPLATAWRTEPAIPPVTVQPTQPPAPTASPPRPTATDTPAAVPAGWQTQTEPRFGYAISYPPSMQGSANGEYSWTLGVAGVAGVVRNFIYVSVVPSGFQSGGGEIYNYNTPDAEALLSMRVAESKVLHSGANMSRWYTYTRLPDTRIGGHTASAYVNAQPWEFPLGTKEIRYYVQTERYTYLLGGYIDAQGSNQPGAITENLFSRIISTIRLAA